MVRSSGREDLAPFAMSNQWGGFSQMELFPNTKIFWDYGTLWYAFPPLQNQWNSLILQGWSWTGGVSQICDTPPVRAHPCRINSFH